MIRLPKRLLHRPLGVRDVHRIDLSKKSDNATKDVDSEMKRLAINADPC